jgi:hypothetical protein
VDVKKRIKIHEILEHDWLKTSTEFQLKLEEDKDIFQANFHNMLKFKMIGKL